MDAQEARSSEGPDGLVLAGKRTPADPPGRGYPSGDAVDAGAAFARVRRHGRNARTGPTFVVADGSPLSRAEDLQAHDALPGSQDMARADRELHVFRLKRTSCRTPCSLVSNRSRRRLHWLGEKRTRRSERAAVLRCSDAFAPRFSVGRSRCVGAQDLRHVVFNVAPYGSARKTRRCDDPSEVARLLLLCPGCEQRLSATTLSL
jgi:hypothetical protein